MKGISFNGWLAVISTLLVTVVVLISASCGKSDSTKTQAAPAPPVQVVVASVQQKTVPIYSEFVGQTKAYETVDLRARVEGGLEKIHFSEGSHVRKGQLLFSIDTRPFVAALQSAQATLHKAESDLAQARQSTDVIKAQAELADAQAVSSKTEQDLRRIRPLAKEKAVTELELDAADAANKSAKANVDAKQAELTNLEASVKYTIERAAAEVAFAKSKVTEAQLDLGYCSIYSPISGVIGFKNVDVGNLVGRGEATLLATVSTADPLLVDFSLSEVDYLTLTDPSTAGQRTGGRKIELVLADDSLHPYPGSLRVVDRKVDPSTGTLKVQVSFPNPGGYLRPGQFARIRAVVAWREDAVVVPQLAIQELQGSKSLMVVDEANKVSVRTVKVGEKSENDIIILEGVKPGERIVVEGMQKVRPGGEVIPVASEPAAATPES